MNPSRGALDDNQIVVFPIGAQHVVLDARRQPIGLAVHELRLFVSKLG